MERKKIIYLILCCFSWFLGLFCEKLMEPYFENMPKLIVLLIDNLPYIIGAIGFLSIPVLLIIWKVQDKFKEIKNEIKKTEKELVQLIHEVNNKCHSDIENIKNEIK